jgi:hypothetical protein
MAGTGAGLAGLLALLLLLLLRRKKKPVTGPLDGETGEVTTTMDESDEYVSEYGLSDGAIRQSQDEDMEDLPNPVKASGDAEGSSVENLSEYNPDEDNDCRPAPDEG